MPRCRPFKLADILIIVAAAAVWMAMTRPAWNQFRSVWSETRKPVTWEAYLGMVQMSLGRFLFMLTAAYLLMRLIPPRPPRSELIRQPGMLYLGLTFAVTMILMPLSLVVPLVAWTNVPIALALGILWFAACRRYRWCAEPGWIEAIGRTVAIGWIVVTLAAYPLSLLR
jgi:hypothetical protein